MTKYELYTMDYDWMEADFVGEPYGTGEYREFASEVEKDAAEDALNGFEVWFEYRAV